MDISTDPSSPALFVTPAWAHHCNNLFHPHKHLSKPTQQQNIYACMYARLPVRKYKGICAYTRATQDASSPAGIPDRERDDQLRDPVGAHHSPSSGDQPPFPMSFQYLGVRPSRILQLVLFLDMGGGSIPINQKHSTRDTYACLADHHHKSQTGSCWRRWLACQLPMRDTTLHTTHTHTHTHTPHAMEIFKPSPPTASTKMRCRTAEAKPHP